MKLMAIGLVMAASLAAGGCGSKKSEGSDAVAKMTAFKDQMCACKDAACATKVTEAMGKYTEEMAKNAGKGKVANAEDAKKLGEISTKIAECSSTAMAAAAGSAAPAGSAAAGSGSAAPDPGSAAAGSAAPAADCTPDGKVPYFVLGYFGVNTDRANAVDRQPEKSDKSECVDVERDGKKMKRCTETWSKHGGLVVIFEAWKDEHGNEYNHARNITVTSKHDDLTTNESVAVGSSIDDAKKIYGECMKQEGSVYSVRQTPEPDADIMEFTVDDKNVITKIQLRAANEAK
jgi:hypothetical protein